VSVASNIVEGCAGHSEADYIHFLDMAYGSIREVEYQVVLAHTLGYLPDATFKSLDPKCHETGRVLNGLIQDLRKRVCRSPTA
jgi:four helix bundle protein